MSIFNKVFASVGIGSAQVDTKLEKDVFVPGEEIEGLIEVRGGKTEQEIDGIYLSLYTSYIKEQDDKKYTSTVVLDRFRITELFTIKPQEIKSIPFSFTLPLDAPLTLGRTKIWVTTGLDIKNAIDPTDKDYIRVIPNQLMSAVFTALEGIGFRLREADCKEAKRGMRRRLPTIQEFEFVPYAGAFRGKLDELELVFSASDKDHIELFLQVDRKARGLGGFLSEALETDETNVRLTVDTSDIPVMKQKLESVIKKYS
ncbi:sporulation protein [Mesobacillus harenae]|uniref:sporulation protein n=1 Tax=Mesobacillus harenae TaxID=2213203 RepID=UPI001580E610|nr:sporulation protein [Mesobacillus harenae]